MAKPTEHDLHQFQGGDEKYVHFLRKLVYTEGVKYMADVGEAYWLIDAIMSHQIDPKIKNNTRLRQFQLWELKVHPDDADFRSAVLTCREDTDEPPVIQQDITLTDFPLDYIKLYVEGDTLMLPSEH